jgi:hypothetical protein
MGTALAVDGFFIETVKPDPKDLNGQEVSCYRNRKGVWGLISQVACVANAKIRFVQTDWPGATNDLTCFRETALFMLLKSDNLPEWMHIIADEAYSPLSAECGWRINPGFLARFYFGHIKCGATVFECGITAYNFDYGIHGD